MYSKRMYHVIKNKNEKKVGELCTVTVTVILKTEHCILGLPVFSTKRVLSEEPQIRLCHINK